MGDFNINLLNSDSYLVTDEFLDILTQFYYTPHILQPTRTRLSDICKHNILYNKQFGLRSSYSTIYAVLSILDNIHKAIENKFFSCGIFLDLSKDFDSVDHNILLHKLNHYGQGFVIRLFYLIPK